MVCYLVVYYNFMLPLFRRCGHANYSSVNLNALKTDGRRMKSVSDLIRSRLRDRLSN